MRSKPRFDYGDAALSPFGGLRAARGSASPGRRLADLRAAALEARQALLASGGVRYYRSLDLVRVPYPLRYALRDACTLPWPLVHLLNRLFVVQVDTSAGLRTVLVSPSDARANRETPFFRRLTDGLGALRGALEPVLAPEIRTVPQALAVTGVSPEDVDYITYDHLHTQDLRAWLGAGERTGLFPNARLLVMREEWQATQSLSPPQRDWYCPDGTLGVHPSRVVLLDHDVLIGDALALVHTPGHTMGNHSIAARTPEGVFVTSENGVSADAYAPERSRLPGLRAYARSTGMEVVLNGNTLEGGLAQYESMIVEKTLAGSSVRAPDLPNVAPSSELSAYWLFPGLAPSHTVGELCFGAPASHTSRA